jgi:hypothetical protein
MLPVVVQKPEAAAMAGTAVLATSPMANSPTDTSVRIAPNLCAFAQIIANSSTTVRMTSRCVYIYNRLPAHLFPSTIRFFICSLLFLVRPSKPLSQLG